MITIHRLNVNEMKIVDNLIYRMRSPQLSKHHRPVDKSNTENFRVLSLNDTQWSSDDLTAEAANSSMSVP
ncbi:unnamed protein product [Heligmosomoides polygyrus]|uniref:Uncharacterized protein n=1 Tax=Heligmosomoides polygyrus TaxID=6339 RepID=A0A3P7ZY04_HELPZ|nr:unnamed protein product [Heligmosomoides polygyrus]